jgi:CheY-like chemotaxis protein
MRILLIDDDKDDQFLFCEALKEISENIAFDVADNGIQGIRLLNDSKTLPDFLFLDINMPLMNGWETLKIIRASPPLHDLPVTMYSTSNCKEEMYIFQKMQAKYIVKPGSFETLIQTLRNELNEVEINRNQSNSQIAC